MPLGEHVSTYARTRWPRDTAKHAARHWRIQAGTARNVTRGHCSIQTLGAAVEAEGWAFWIAIGEAVIGRPYADELSTLIEGAERERQRVSEQRERIMALEARAAAMGFGPRAVAHRPSHRAHRL